MGRKRSTRPAAKTRARRKPVGAKPARAIARPTRSAGRARVITPPRPTIFISYRHAAPTTGIANKLFEALAPAADAWNADVFMDDHEVEPADLFDEKIVSALERTTVAHGDSTEATAEVVARKLLGYELTPLQARASAPPEAELEAQRSATPEASAPAVADTSRVAEQAVAGAEKPVVFVSCGVTEATAYVYRTLVRGLQDRLPDMEVIGSDFVDFADTLRRSRVESILARAVATLVVVARDGVRASYASEEIALALQSGGRIIPVLLDGAPMPTEDELPPAIRMLTRWNALELDALHGGPEALTRLVERVAETLGAGAAPPAPARDQARFLIYLCSHADDRPRHTYRLRQDLADRFGPESTHTQLTALVPPDPAPDREALPEAALAHAHVVLLVIGPAFATLLREVPQVEPDVPVPLLKTLRAALTMRRSLVPLLVDGATMPHSGDLPEELHDLPMRLAFAVRERSWAEDVTRLGDIIERSLGVPGLK